VNRKADSAASLAPVRTVQEAARAVQQRLGGVPRLAVILGSGLGDFAARLADVQAVPVTEIPHYPPSTVTGHAGEWVKGRLQGCPVLAVRGRVHFYEGYPMPQVAFPVRVLAALGVSHLIVTNAAGGVNPVFQPGDLMLIDDHINLLFNNPLIAPEPGGRRFVDMSAPYSPRLMSLAEQVALDMGVSLRRGVLAATTGPTYETSAEIHMLRRLGADAATMSTVPEVIVANQLGLEVLGISCITNLATGLSEARLDHREVTEVAAMVAGKFQRLVAAVIVKIYETDKLDRPR